MSQVTRCPACGTRFKVVADQLRISQGWVRCGVCHEIFDASQDLLPMPSPAGAAPAAPSHAPVAPAGAAGQMAAMHRAGSVPMGQAGAPIASPPAFPPTSTSASTPASPPAGYELPGAFGDLPPGQPQGMGQGAGHAGHAGHSVPATPAAERKGRPTPAADQDFDTLMSRFVGDEMDMLAQPQPQPQPQQPEPIPEPTPESEPEPAREPPAEMARKPRPEPAPEPAPAPGFSPLSTPGLPGRPHRSEPAAAVQAPAGAAAIEDVARQEASASLPSPEFSRWPESGSGAEALPEAEPGFVREARRKAFWRRPAVRGLLLLGSLGCVAALAAQVMWQQRDALAVQHPGLAPTLRTLCAMAGCELQPRRQIADVVIASSGFRQTPRNGQYQWSLSLENRSDLPVAMPAVELTLTDAQDKPLLRRVIRLDQLGAPAQIEANGEWSVTAPVEVQDLGASIAGYRALVFYP